MFITKKEAQNTRLKHLTQYKNAVEQSLKFKLNATSYPPLLLSFSMPAFLQKLFVVDTIKCIM